MSGKLNTTSSEESTTPPAAYSIPEFCAAHRISQAFYFELRKQGLGPREMALGSRRIITMESAAEWRRERTGPRSR